MKILCNLFGTFDPYVVTDLFGLVYIKWFVVLMIFFFLNWQFFISLSGSSIMINSFIKMFKSSFGPLIKKLSESFLILISLFLGVLMVNIFGLFPYVFTLSSHISVNLVFSLTLWGGGVILSIINSLDKFLSKMVPSGTPFVLWFFLVLVETVSLFIRPLTLAIRLMANVVAGHLILNLFGMFVSTSLFNLLFIPLQSAFLMFEFCISTVQAYVFVSLLSLYWDESK